MLGAKHGTGWVEPTSATTWPADLCNPTAPAAGVLNPLGVGLRLTNAQATSRAKVTAAIMVRRRRVDDRSRSLRSTTVDSPNIHCFTHSGVGGHHLYLALTDDTLLRQVVCGGCRPHPLVERAQQAPTASLRPPLEPRRVACPGIPNTGSRMAAPARTGVANPFRSLDRDCPRSLILL